MLCTRVAKAQGGVGTTSPKLNTGNKRGEANKRRTGSASTSAGGSEQQLRLDGTVRQRHGHVRRLQRVTGKRRKKKGKANAAALTSATTAAQTRGRTERREV